MPPTKGIDRTSYTPHQSALASTSNPLDGALALLGMVSWRLDVTTLEFSHAGAPLESLLGCIPAAATNAGSIWLPIVHPADRQWLVAYRELMLGDALVMSYDCSYRALMPDGRERWIQEVAAITRNRSHDAVALEGVLADITGRREQEERRAEGAERFRAAFEDASTGVAIVGLDGVFLEVNREFSEIVGLPISRLLEMRIADIQIGDFHANGGDALASISSNESAHSRREREYLRDGGEPRWVIETTSVIHDGEARPSYYVVQALDVTERRDAQRALIAAEAQLLQAQKMEALGLLAGGVAHDFNNLLTVIKSYSQLVLETLERDTPEHEDLSEVVGAADRAATLTKQLLAFSRKQVQHWQSLRVDGIVVEMERMLRRLLGTNAELVVDAETPVGEVEGDKGQLEQVIMNLVVNARDAMPNGGLITVTARDVHLDAPTSATVPSIVPAGDYTVLEVIDTGTGMDAATIERIFEPFFTTKAAGHGTGLGLSTVYGIIQQCGGFLVVSSVLRQGSRFGVYLPHRFEEVKGTDGEVVRAVEGGTETILVIEDDASVRSLTRSVLSRLGYSVIAAGDGKEAIKLAGAFDAEIHLLLCDVHLPGGSGYRAAEQIRVTRPDARVMFMSGHMDLSIPDGERSAAVALLQSLDVFPKPFSGEQLAFAVRDTLDSCVVVTHTSEVFAR